MRLAARTRVVSTVVLIIIRTVIEKTFHAAHTGPIVNDVLRRAKALLVADPVRWQGPWVGALLTLALATVLTPVGMQAQIFLAQWLKLTWFELRFGLHSDYSISNQPRGEGGAQQSLFRGAAAGARPHAAPRP